MVVCVPVTQDGQVGDTWERTHDVVIARVDNATGRVDQWDEFPIRWDERPDSGGREQQHARIARFLTEHGVEQVICGYISDSVLHMLQRMDIGVVADIHGNAQEAASRYGQLGGLPD